MRYSNKYSAKDIKTIKMDINNLIHVYLLKENKIQQEVFINKIIEQLNIDNIFKDSFLTQEQKVQILLKSNESKIEKLISKFPVYDMFYWMSRIAPHNIFNCSKDMIFSYRNLMYLAIEKYCKQSREFDIIGNFVYPDYMSVLDIEFMLMLLEGKIKPTDSQNKALCYINKILNACYGLESLAYAFVYLTKTYRTVIKGGVLRYHQNKGLWFEFDEDLNYLISSYDKRIEKVNILSYAGSYFEMSVKSNGNFNYSILLYQTNVENINLKTYLDFLKKINPQYVKLDLITTKETSSANLMINFLNMEKYLDFVKIFFKEFADYYKFDFKDFFIFLIGITNYDCTIFRNELEGALSLIQRGYSITSIDTLKGNFIDNYNIIAETVKLEITRKNENLEKTFYKIFEYLLLKEENCKDLNFRTFGPRKVFIKINETNFIMDRTAIPNVLEHILSPIAKDKEEKGYYLEDVVLKEIQKIFGEKSIWTCGKVRSNNYSRDIDVSFIYKNTLFILECKANNMSFGYFIGDKKSIDFRINKNKKNIKQADKTLDFIYNNQHELNIPIPPHVRYIASIIVTHSPEYIWEKNDNLFIDKFIPRILCVNELKKLHKDSTIRRLKTKKFCYKINNI